MRRTPSIRFRIDFGDDLHVGPGKIALLESIAELGSLNRAAGAVGLSYRRAWLLLDSLNRSFDRPVVDTSIGGKHGGGSSVTDFGRLLIKSYRHMEHQIGDIGADCLKPVLPRVVQRPLAEAMPPRQRLAKQVVPTKPKPHNA